MAYETSVRGGHSTFFVLYQFVGAIISAVATIAFLSDFTVLGLHGVLLSIAQFLNHYVRPTEHLFFDPIERWTGHAIEPFWRDYLVLGGITLIAYMRATFLRGIGRAGSGLVGLLLLILDVIQNIFLWPIALLRALLHDFETDPGRAPYVTALALSPVFVFLIMFSLNHPTR